MSHQLALSSLVLTAQLTPWVHSTYSSELCLNMTFQGILINIYEQLNTYQSEYSLPGMTLELINAIIVPGPSPFASPSPAVATTAWPTTATWNTASQPATVPTTAPPNAPAAPAQVSAMSANVSYYPLTLYYSPPLLLLCVLFSVHERLNSYV